MVRTLLWWSALSALAIGCREPGGDACEAWFGAGAYEVAAAVCSARYQRGDAAAGGRAAWSAYMLGREDDVLRWAERLGDAPAGGAAWFLAGVVHRGRGEPVRARAAYQRALRGQRRAGDWLGAAQTLRGLFELAWLEADYQSALAHARQAETFARRAGSAADVAAAIQGRFDVSYDVGDYAGARAALEALRAAKGAANPHVLLSEGLLHADAGRPALAHARFEQALAGAPRDAAGFRRAAQLDLARADLALARLDHARAHLGAAEALVDSAVSRAAVAAYRARVENAAGQPAAALAAAEAALAGGPVADWRWELSLEAGRAAQALGDDAAAERHYLDAVAVLEDIRRRHDRAELKQSLVARKRAPFDALVALHVRGGAAEQALALAERARARALVEEIARADGGGDAARAVGDALALPLERALAAVGDATALVYFSAGEVTYLFVVRGQRVRAHRLEAATGAIRDAAAALRADPDDAGAAKRLGALVEPPGGFPPPGARVYVVADAALAEAPLAAVLAGGRRWIERNELAWAPSLTTLAAIAGRVRSPSRGAVVLGDPRGDLPGAGAESQAVADALEAAARTGAEASFAALAAARDARVLHVAAHAGAGGLVLADRVVGPGAIVEGGIGPDLAVLATCSGAARRDGGLGGSLTAAFLAAGSRAVIASPWSIADADARRLVLALYASNLEPTPAAALAAAQRRLIGRGEPPSVWAPMAAFGLAHEPIANQED